MDEGTGNFLKTARQLQEKMVSYRRYLHAHPELDLSLPETTSYVKAALEALGLDPVPVGESGLVATISGQKPGKAILLRADMDALPIKEEADIPFASKNGNMHACGHDFHTAMLLGAAEILKANAHRLNGTIKLMFQPGEETMHGAKMMLENGVLENPKVDAAMMIHVFTGLAFPIGMFFMPEPGPSSASSDWFEVVIQGKGGHGAMPNATVDPLNVIAHLHIALQSILCREISPNDNAVLTIGMMEGGSTNNVIPDSARMKGSVRTFDASVRDKIETRIRQISESVAETFTAKAKVTYMRGCPEAICDSALISQMRNSIAETFGTNAFIDMKQFMPGGRLMGSEDFAFVTQEVPSVSIILNAGHAKEGYSYPPHHPKAVFSEDVLYQGAAAYAVFARD